VVQSHVSIMKNILTLGGVFYLLLVYLTYFLYSAGASADGFKQAIQQKNIDQLGQYIDYELLQSSIKKQVKLEVFSEASAYQNERENKPPIGFLEMTLAIKMIEDTIDFYVSREGALTLFNVDESSQENRKDRKIEEYLIQLQSDKFISFKHWRFSSVNSIEAVSYDQVGREYKFVFTFDYLRWVLTDVIVDLRGIDSADVVSFIKKFRAS
jgi:hypothetical protein